MTRARYLAAWRRSFPRALAASRLAAAPLSWAGPNITRTGRRLREIAERRWSAAVRACRACERAQ